MCTPCRRVVAASVVSVDVCVWHTSWMHTQYSERGKKHHHQMCVWSGCVRVKHMWNFQCSIYIFTPLFDALLLAMYKWHNPYVLLFYTHARIPCFYARLWIIFTLIMVMANWPLSAIFTLETNLLHWLEQLWIIFYKLLFLLSKRKSFFFSWKVDKIFSGFIWNPPFFQITDAIFNSRPKALDGDGSTYAEWKKYKSNSNVRNLIAL